MEIHYLATSLVELESNLAALERVEKSLLSTKHDVDVYALRLVRKLLRMTKADITFAETRPYDFENYMACRRASLFCESVV